MNNKLLLYTMCLCWSVAMAQWVYQDVKVQVLITNLRIYIFGKHVIIEYGINVHSAGILRHDRMEYGISVHSAGIQRHDRMEYGISVHSAGILRHDRMEYGISVHSAGILRRMHSLQKQLWERSSHCTERSHALCVWITQRRNDSLCCAKKKEFNPVMQRRPQHKFPMQDSLELSLYNRTANPVHIIIVLNKV